MRVLQLNFLVFSLVMAGLAMAQQMGIDLWGCASCSLVKDYPISSALAYGGPIAIVVLAALVARNSRWAAPLLVLAAITGLTLATFMVMRGTICQICMLTHTGLLAAALAIPHSKVAGLLASALFAASVGFTATEGWTKIQDEFLRVAIFEPRPYEPQDAGATIVVFTDPECVRCKMMEKELAAKPPGGAHLAFRWMLLPHTAYRTQRAAAVIEDLSAIDPRLGSQFRSAVYEKMVPLTDAVLLEIGRGLGCETQVEAILASPSPAALSSIASDQAHAEELKIDQLPALGLVGQADPTGLRTMRLKTRRELDAIARG